MINKSIIAACLFMIGLTKEPLLAQQSTGLPSSNITPDKVQTQFGALEYRDGAPSKTTVDKVYDNLDFTHGLEAFVNAYQGASTYAIRRGLNQAGVADNTVIIFSSFMDSKSLFLTANADVVYYVAILDATKGPLVLETPPYALGIIDDMWFQWVTDFGLAGPDRGTGGRFLLVPPGYTGKLPESGYIIRKMHTYRALMIGRFS